MTATKLWAAEIKCDICGVVVRQSSTNEQSGHDVDSYFARLKEYGWLRNPAGVDICPRCAPQFQNAEWNKASQ